MRRGRVFSLPLKYERVEQCLRSCGSEFQMWVQSKRRCESHESCVCIVGFSACGCQKKSLVYETECRHVTLCACPSRLCVVCVVVVVVVGGGGGGGGGGGVWVGGGGGGGSPSVWGDMC